MTEPTIPQLFDLSGKVALLTGAAGHLGSAFARALAEAGAQVIAASRDLERARSFAASLPGVATGPHGGVVLDHLDEISLNTGFAAAAQHAGKVDILVNNGHDADGHDLTNVTAEQFNRQLANATGYFLLARKFRDHVSSRAGRGSIVLIGSMYGLVGSYPDAYEGVCAASPVHYHTLKGGLVQMTRHLAVYWAKDGIRVNLLSPGPFPTAKAPAEMVRRLETKSPMHRMGQPHELKGALVFLASNASSYVTGQNLVVDGGWTTW